jgi:predicted GNAT family acetyltransferase
MVTSGDNLHEYDVHHREAANRFSIRLGDEVAYLSYHRTDETTRDYVHVWVPPAHRNRGVAAALTFAALEYARGNGLKVIPSCPYVAAYVRRHAGFSDIVDSPRY